MTPLVFYYNNSNNIITESVWETYVSVFSGNLYVFFQFFDVSRGQRPSGFIHKSSTITVDYIFYFFDITNKKKVNIVLKTIIFMFF